MKKRVLSMLMALALCLTLLPTAALAEEAGVVQDAANANSTYTAGENAGLTGGKDGSVPDGTDGGDADSSGEMQDGEADIAVSAVQGASHASHCVCGKDSSTTVNGHEHDTDTAMAETASLPGTAGSYYLTQSVSENWAVPAGEVTLCLNGQTINGSITVGGSAKLTLTDCSGNGKIQGGVTVNGGKFELYSGTITGGVQVGMKGGTYQTGSSFTMYGGAITGNKTDSSSGGGVFLVGTTNQTDPPNFTMHGGTISNNTAGASDGGGGGVYVGEKCSFTMDGGTITGNTATAGNGGGIYIHFNAGNVSISNATITGNKASATGNTSYGHGGGIYSQRGVTVKNVTITGNNSTYEGGGIYGKGAITLTDATVTDNSQYDVYYDGKETTTPELTVSGSVKAGYYANFDWKLPILVSGELSENSVIHVGVREGIKPGYGTSLAIAEPANGVKLRAENFKADAAESETSLGEDGKVYLSPCEHEMDDTGYTCKKCHTQFDARIGESAYYKTLKEVFLSAWNNSTITLMRDVNLENFCHVSKTITLDLHGKTITSEDKLIQVDEKLTVKDSSEGGGRQALNVKFLVASNEALNGTLAVDDSYTGDISCVELLTGGALERFGGKIGELVLSTAGTSTGYGLKLWKGNTNACTIGKITDNTKSKSLTVNDLLGTDYAKCELYGEKDGAWSIVPKTEKISELTGYTAYKVQFTECVHQCADDSNPVCSVCHKDLYTKITAKAADGTTKTAYFTKDSALENGYVEAIQTLNGWSNEGCTEPTLTLLRDMPYGTSIMLTGTLTLESGTHTAKNVTVAENADVTFASGSYRGATINGTATVEAGVTFTDAGVTVNGTLNAKGGTFDGPVEFNGSSTANISGGSFNCEKTYGGVTFDYNVTGTISGGTFAFADFYTTKVKLSGGTFTTIKTNGDRKLADLLAEGAAYYNGDSAVSEDNVSSLANVTVKSHEHNGGTDGNGTCSICGKQMAASLTVGGTTSWYTAFATAIEAANAADGEKTITLYQNVDDTVYGKRTAYELTRGPVTLATGGKTVEGVDLIAKGISLTVTGSNGSFYVTVDGKDAELTVNDGNTELAIVTAQNGGKLSLSNGTFSRVAVKDDGSSASLSGGIYGEITSDTGYVKPYALLAKGYAYKDTKEDKWLPNANSISSKVTVEKAPFAVEKIYPNNDTGYTGSSAFATDGNITLTAVIAPETQGVTYYYWWELFDESKNDWTTKFSNVNTATHTGGQSKTLTISGLPVDKSYQYHIFVQCSNGYNCYSEPFTVTRHQHSWTYTASGATITASCTDTTCTSPNGGSVTIKAPAELTYSGEGKPATVTASSDWQGPAASGITISYIKSGKYIQQLENGALPTNAGTYTASITVGEGNKAATASVEYTIQKANPVVTEWPTLSAPVYVSSVATLTGGSGEGTFDFKAGAAKSWDSAGSKTTTIVFTPTDTNNYNELTQDYTVTVVKRTVKSCNMLTGITDKPCGTAQEELGLPGTVTITTEDGKTFNDIPVTWSGYNPNTLEEQTLTGTLNLTSIADEVKQPSTPVTAQIKVKLTQKNFSGISPVAYEGEYDGNAHGITLTGVPSGATVKYGESPDSCTQDSLTYTNFTNGAKIVYYKVSQSGYADASGSAWVKITKRPLTVTGITVENKTYDGKTAATVDNRGTLTNFVSGETLVHSVSAAFADKNVGIDKMVNLTITLTASGITKAENYTISDNSQKTTTADITAKEVTLTGGISAVNRRYDANSRTVSLTKGALTFTGLIDGETLDVNIPATGTISDAKVGTYNVTYSGVTLAGSSTGLAANYKLVGALPEITVEITKAAAPAAEVGSLTITNGLHKTYSLDLSTLLPKLTAPCDYGTITYDKKVDTHLGSGTFVTLVNGKTGELTLEADRSGTDEGQFGTITVTISTSNYQDITLTVHVSAKNKLTPVLAGTLTLTPTKITYGEPLSKIKITGTMKDGDTVVEGTFSWQQPGNTILDASTLGHDIGWKFIPKDGNAYTEAAGTATVKVDKAQQNGKVSMAGYTYGQTPSTPTLINRTGDPNAQVTYYYSSVGNGNMQVWSINDPPALNAGTYRMSAKIGETNNYYEYNAEFCEFVVAKATPTYTAPTGLTAKYGQTLEDVTLPDGWSWMNSSESVGDASTVTKTFQAKFTPKDTENYNTVENIELEVMVNKADGRNLKTVELEQKYTDASEHTYTPDWAGLPAGQDWTFSSEASIVLSKQDFAADGSLLTYAISGGKAGDKITITLKASCNNYEDFTITLTITLTEKDNQQALRITGGTTVVYGQTLALNTSGGSGSGAVTYTVVNGTGEATIDPNTGVLTPVKVGSVSVIATKAGDNDYNAVTSAPVEITITKATPTGEPKYTEIKTGGKTLADAALAIEGSTLKPNAGTLEWVDDKGNVLSNDTKVEANTTYKWRFTPTDGNYTVLTGSIELYHKSSSGGSGWYYTYYTIKATAGTNGSISPSGWTSVRDGRDQTFTITPDKGYAVAKVLVDGKSVGAVKSYTFKNVTKDHTIEAIFMKSNGNPQTGVFVDVAEGSYYEEAIDWAVEKGITNGVSSNMFAPNDPCTRAQIVTFLWRAAGSPAPKSMSSFTDVPADAFYAKAVAWAVENGITSGTGESKFSPNSTCTRAQAVTFLYRASGSPAVSGKAEFSDVSTTAFYADAVAWAAKKGITTGIGGGLFGSDNDCTRGQIVTFLWRAMAE